MDLSSLGLESEWKKKFFKAVQNAVIYVSSVAGVSCWLILRLPPLLPLSQGTRPIRSRCIVHKILMGV